MPELFKIGPRFLVVARSRLIEQVDRKANTGVERQVQRLIGDKDAVFKGCSDHVNHHGASQENRSVLARREAPFKRHCGAFTADSTRNSSASKIWKGKLAQKLNAVDN